MEQLRFDSEKGKFCLEGKAVDAEGLGEPVLVEFKCGIGESARFSISRRQRNHGLPYEPKEHEIVIGEELGGWPGCLTYIVERKVFEEKIKERAPNDANAFCMGNDIERAQSYERYHKAIQYFRIDGEPTSPQ